MQEHAYKPMSPASAPGEAELPADLSFHQYDILFRLTTQILATGNMNDRLSLVLDAMTFDLGYSHAVFAIVDPETGTLRIRMALGFDNDQSVCGLRIPRNLGRGFGD